MRAKNLIYASLGLFLTTAAVVALPSCAEGGGSCVGAGSLVFEDQCSEDSATGECRAWNAAELNGHTWAHGLGTCDARGFPEFCEALGFWFQNEDDCRAVVNLVQRPSVSTPNCYTFCPENDSLETCEALRVDPPADGETIEAEDYVPIDPCDQTGDDYVLPGGEDYCAYFVQGADLSEECIDKDGFVELVILQSDDAPIQEYRYSCRLDDDPGSCG